VQDFTPTPMTVATVIYYSGYHPYSLKKIPTPRSAQEKKDQNRFFFWYKRENRQWIRKTLERLKKTDLADRLLGDAGDGRKRGAPSKKRKKRPRRGPRQ